jgi:glycosyltransferase involved in cell wall biosynthesis
MARVLRGRVAVAGPSTNHAWNEQRRPNAPDPAAADDAVERYARALAMRARAAAREPAPPDSLGDFCYVARRDVLLALGGADETCGESPCWEMELNARARSAGRRGLWVMGAYVHRAPRGEVGFAREGELRGDAEREYQERRGAARLRGGRHEYRGHSRGDARPNYAPRGPAAAEVAPAASPSGGSPVTRGGADDPLVSCILPTRDRPGFLVEAVRNFLAQDYPRKELVVVDDGDAPVRALLPDDERIVYVRPRERLPLGVKRNVACARARGEIIAHFDDDDWYPPARLSTQVGALTGGGGAICGTSRLYFFDPLGGRAWLYSRPGARWVAGSTLAYLRSYWGERPFAPVSVGEDSRFVAGGGAELIDLCDPNLCVAMIHARNTCPKRPAAPLWRAAEPGAVRLLLGGRLGAYREALDAVALPLVSCVMPTFDRPSFVALALANFEAQSYPNKELIVVDDGTLPVEASLRGRDDVRYHRLRRRARIGDKRNVGNSLARGEIVCLWDDDDWYSPERVRYQTLPILYGEADLTAIKSAFLLSLPTGEVWSASDALLGSMFEGGVAGGTLAYRRAVARRVRYPSTSLGEDASLIRRALAEGFRLTRLDNGGHFVYMRHDRNTWGFEAGKFIDPVGWRLTSLPRDFPPSLLPAYQLAGRNAAGAT